MNYFKYFLIVINLWISFNLIAEDKPFTGNKEELVGVFYYNQIFGHIHKGSSIESTSLTTLSCGFPVKVYKTNSSESVGWELAEVGEFKGYIKSEFLSEKTPECFQSKYSKFFNGLNLDIAELWFWGRLYDQYIMVKAKAQ